MNTTLRNNLVNLINELNKLLILTENEEKKRDIRKLRRVLFLLLEEVVIQEIDPNTPQFQAAILALRAACNQVEAAKANLDHLTQALTLTVTAASAVDKIVKVLINVCV